MTQLATCQFPRTAMAVATALAFGPAVAEDDELAQFIKPESTVSVGIGNWSRDRHQLGIYDSMREGKAYGLLDADIATRDDASGTWLTLIGRNLGLDSPEVRAEWLRQGNVGASIEFSRLTRDNPLTFTTGLQGIGSANQTISGAGASALPARNVTLDTTREMTQLGFYKNLMRNLELRASFKNEEKDGARHWGLGSNPYFITEPIDSTTRQFEVSLNYTAERLQLSGGYYGSSYANHDTLVWGLINGAAQPGTTSSPNPTPLTLPLDNQSHQLYLNGGYAFTPTTRGTFKVSYGTATQDETLPTYNLAAPNNRFLGAPSHLDGRIDTTLAELGLSSRPLPKLSLVANVRYYDVNDKTPRAGFVGSNVTLVPTVYNTPHSIETTSAKFEATYRLPDGFSLTGGLDYRDQDRSAPSAGTLYVPFRKHMNETTYRLQVRRSLSETINGSLAYLDSNRDSSSSVLTGDVSEDAINPMHIADRKRNKWRGMVDWSPAERLSFQFVVEDSRDDYGPSSQPQGLEHGSANLYSIDANYAINDEWQISAWYSRDVAKARELGQRTASGGAALAQKDAHLKETADAVGLGLRGHVTSKAKVGGNFEWVRSITKHQQDLTLLGAGAAYPTNVGITEAPLSDITNRMTRLKLFAEYDVAKTSTVRLDLIHERWRTDDWTWTFNNGLPFTYGATADGTIVTAKPKQVSSFVGIRYLLTFQ